MLSIQDPGSHKPSKGSRSSETSRDESEVPLGGVSRFLRSRYKSGLQAGTVNSYLSAILSFHSGCRDGCSAVNNQVLKFLIEGMENSRPRVRNMWPSWDLPTVLIFLNESPFEPLQAAPLRCVAMKTLFLTAIAPGKRCSELHALSVGKYTIFSKTGVTLYFRPGFFGEK